MLCIENLKEFKYSVLGAYFETQSVKAGPWILPLDGIMWWVCPIHAPMSILTAFLLSHNGLVCAAVKTIPKSSVSYKDKVHLLGFTYPFRVGVEGSVPHGPHSGS